jgi:hypothetical protein
MGFL